MMIEFIVTTYLMIKDLLLDTLIHGEWQLAEGERRDDIYFK